MKKVPVLSTTIFSRFNALSLRKKIVAVGGILTLVATEEPPTPTTIDPPIVQAQ